MQIEKLNIENIKGFSRTELSFLTEHGEPAKWVSLYEESGAGKTTLLQILSLLLAGIEGATQLLPNPEHWLRDQRLPGRIWFDYTSGKGDLEYWSDEDALEYGEYEFIRPAIRQCRGLVFVGSLPLILKYRHVMLTPLGDAIEDTRTRTFTEPAIVEANQHMEEDSCEFSTSSFANTQGYFAAAYRLPFPERTKVEHPAILANEPDTRVRALAPMFGASASLAGPGVWAQYLSRRASRGDERAARNLAEAHSYLESLKEVEIGDGLLQALYSDLFWKLVRAFPDSTDFFQEEGVVLIENWDELSFGEMGSASIPNLLHQRFPNIQFIVASHQPALPH